MRPIDDFHSPDIPGYQIPGLSQKMIMELESCSRLITDQIDYLKDLHLEQIANDSRKESILNKNGVFADSHDGETCFILGGGPSLNEVDLNRLKDTVIFGVNEVFKAVDCPTIDFHVVSDAGFYTKNGSDGVPRGDFFSRMHSICGKSRFFTTFQTHDQVIDLNLEFFDRMNFVRLFPFALSSGIRRRLDLVEGFPAPQNVAQFSIMIAITMGFKNIVLVGFDHNIPLNGTWRHAYEEKVENRLPVGFSVPNSDTLWFTWQMFRGYQYLAEYARKHGVNIVKGSEGSMLDQFSYQDYRDFL